ncbi:hypothetical protein GQ42DRAFT_152272 [Ramicandelaber brevisporus]|nr:hypothetical protein GQ42DRAFT_152272 [Ramicandelaber brevisporus]
MTDFLPEFKFLQVLILRDDYAAYNPGPSTFIMPNKIMSRLRSIELSHLELAAEIVRFIFYCCPSLVELKIGYCTISSDVVEYANEVSKNVNSAVRHLRLKGCFQAELDLWVEFISNFKNLKDILVNIDSDGVDYLEEKFTERFPSAKVIKYPG